MNTRNDRPGGYDTGQTQDFSGTELMGGTTADSGDSDLYVEGIMAPSPAEKGTEGRFNSGFGGQRGYAAETGGYGDQPASYPGGNQEVSRGPAPRSPQFEREYRPGGAARPPVQPQRTPASGAPQSPPAGMRTEQHVDRVQGRRPGLLETLRQNIVPVAFIGVGVGLIINKKPSPPQQEEIHTTVRTPEQPQQYGQYPPRPDTAGVPGSPDTRQPRH